MSGNGGRNNDIHNYVRVLGQVSKSVCYKDHRLAIPSLEESIEKSKLAVG